MSRSSMLESWHQYLNPSSLPEENMRASSSSANSRRVSSRKSYALTPGARPIEGSTGSSLNITHLLMRPSPGNVRQASYGMNSLKSCLCWNLGQMIAVRTTPCFMINLPSLVSSCSSQENWDGSAPSPNWHHLVGSQIMDDVRWHLLIAEKL